MMKCVNDADLNLRRSQRLVTSMNKGSSYIESDRYNINKCGKLPKKKQRSSNKANVKTLLKLSSYSTNILEGGGTQTFSEQFPPNQNSSAGYCDSGAAEMKTETPAANKSQTKISSELLDTNAKISPSQLLTIDLCTPDTAQKKFCELNKVKHNSKVNILLGSPAKDGKRQQEIKAKKSFAEKFKGKANKSGNRKTSSMPKTRSRCCVNTEVSLQERQSHGGLTMPLHPLRYYDNTKEWNSLAPNSYILPPLYPPHFVHQRSITECEPGHMYPTIPLWPQQQTDLQTNLYSTPDFFQSYDFDTFSTSTPSLPGSLRGVFESNDIREILHADKVAYRLSEHHVKALALVLNLSADYLCYVLESILKLSPSAIQKISAALEISTAVGESNSANIAGKSNNPTHNIEPPKSEYAVEVIDGSPIAGQQRYFPSQRRVE